jgi:hypothetical protein
MLLGRGLVSSILNFRYTDLKNPTFYGCGAKFLALLQNQHNILQLGKLINLIIKEITQKGKNFVSNCGNVIFALQPKMLYNEKPESQLKHLN